MPVFRRVVPGACRALRTSRAKAPTHIIAAWLNDSISKSRWSGSVGDVYLLKDQTQDVQLGRIVLRSGLFRVAVGDVISAQILGNHARPFHFLC